MDYRKITRPTLILDEAKCRSNIRAMTSKAAHSSVQFRPHFKTHQSLTVGKWFREEGVSRITVSSVTMAMHFGLNGWHDITVAFPLNPRETDSLAMLSEKCSINVLTPEPEHLDLIESKIRFKAGCYIKLNIGLNRSGVEWDDYSTILRMVEKIEHSKALRFKGFIIHAGHTYKAGSKSEILDIYRDTQSKTSSVRQSLAGREFIISAGDTPSFSITNDFTGFDEIRPGNFVFYDLKQAELGSCSREQVAVALACPVVEKNRRRNEIIIYGGGVHLSKDNIRKNDGTTIFGEVVLLHEDGWTFPEERSFLRSLSQEHGIISAGKDLLNNIKTGELLGIIPVHSCMTADLMRVYHTLDNGIIDDFSPK